MSLCSGVSSHYPHLRSPYTLDSVQCFFVRSCLHYLCVCTQPTCYKLPLCGLLKTIYHHSLRILAFLLHHTMTEYRTVYSKATSSPRVFFSVLKVFFFVMNDPAVLILLLEQGDRSLKDRNEDFVFLSNYTHYPDNCLCSFYDAGLNTTT